MPITPQEALQRTIEHREIFHDEMVDLMRQVMRGEVSPTMTGAILSGLRVKMKRAGSRRRPVSVITSTASTGFDAPTASGARMSAYQTNSATACGATTASAGAASSTGSPVFGVATALPPAWRATDTGVGRSAPSSSSVSRVAR